MARSDAGMPGPIGGNGQVLAFISKVGRWALTEAWMCAKFSGSRI